MNDNNLFDDNQNTNPFEQPTENNETTLTENVSTEPDTPVETPITETPAVDMGINVLNNVGANAPDVKQQVKKSVSKTPFIIIVAVLILSLFVGGGGYAVKTLIFDKAPNDVNIPNDDESHMIKEEDETEEEPEDEYEEVEDESTTTDEDGDSQTKPEQGDSSSTGNQSNTSSSTLEETVKREEKGQTKISVENFEADGSETIGFYLNNDKILFQVTKISNDIVIYKKEAIEGDVEKGTSVEIYRKSFEPQRLVAEDGSTYLSSFIIHGTTTGSYALFKIDVEGEGTYLLFDENINLLQEGYYDASTEPYATDEAIYFPTIECGDSKHTYKINKLDINTGSINVLKSNDYNNDTAYCE